MFNVLEYILHAGVILEVVVEDNGHVVSFMGDYKRNEGIIKLSALHVEGPGFNFLGVAGLRVIANEVMEFLNAEVLEISGAVRTTGTRPGRVPKPLHFRRR